MYMYDLNMHAGNCIKTNYRLFQFSSWIVLPDLLVVLQVLKAELFLGLQECHVRKLNIQPRLIGCLHVILQPFIFPQSKESFIH